MSKLFETSSIHTLALKNRFFRAATWEGLASPDGAVSPRLIEMMVALARGGVGLIISSHAYVSREGQGTPWQLGINDDVLIPGLREMTAAVHRHGGKIALQLAHAGQYAEEGLTGLPALAVADAAHLRDRNVRVVSADDIQRLVAAYAQAAARAVAAGFDGLELHAAHGYFLSQFLSPAYNTRDDEYGGSVGNRTRIHRQIHQAIRKAVGPDVPLLIKMNCADFIENGLTATDSLQAARILAETGFDAIEVSGGIIRTGTLSPSRPGITRRDQEAYFRDYARQFKARISKPLILVGGVRSFEVADQLVAQGIADYISLSRPLIREPDLINRWQGGDLRKAECVSDNLCFTPGFEGRGIGCVTRERQKNKHSSQPLTGEYS
ncbi:MAG: NADH:flavin oxidoreductase [Desulfobulbaceae bacterium A2]|nr:MAG: NADH:flavin oxidoreductase [Desulfobulbaceae bacterium A2]